MLIARIFNPIGPGMPPYLALGEFARQIASAAILAWRTANRKLTRLPGFH